MNEINQLIKEINMLIDKFLRDFGEYLFEKEYGEFAVIAIVTSIGTNVFKEIGYSRILRIMEKQMDYN